MDFNPEIHHRKSYRLKEYDYSQEGLYFTTLCTKDRECFFGNIVIVGTSYMMSLNDAGKNADACWLEIPKHFPNAILHEHVVMPNHVHGIIELTKPVGTRHDVGTRYDIGTRHVVSLPNNSDASVGTSYMMSPQHQTPTHNKFSQPIAGSVSVIIQQYKSSVKRWCNKNNHKKFQWQSRFHDHIIRNDESYKNIANYILNNPSNWKDDKFFKS